MERYLSLGVDGGGTTTRAVIIDNRLAVLGRGEAPSSNHYGVGLEKAVKHIGQAVELALEAASVQRRDIANWGFGLAGACSQSEQRMLRRSLCPLSSVVTCVVDEDAAAAWAGAFALPDGSIEPGAVMIAGTGATCFGVNGEGSRRRADGLGPLLGDRGSGYWIGEQTLRAICAAHDGAAPPTSLLPAVLAHYEVTSVDALVELVYSPSFPRSGVATTLKLVMEHAETDAVAAGILAAAGTLLAQTAAAVLRPLGLNAVAITGGVLQNAVRVRAAFEEELGRTVTHPKIIEPRYDAAVGAALLRPTGSDDE